MSSLILKSLKEDAETHLGEEVTEAVISVPAYFNDNQRHATKIAGELAGLKVERLINEPTAAAMAYGVNNKDDATVIVLDMGGGTFDVSILEFFEGIMEVHATTGDNFLGGEDFVEVMVAELLKELSIDQQDLSNWENQELHRQMEIAKRKISQQPEQTLELVLCGKKYQWTFTDKWFERICRSLLLRVQRPIESALRDAQLSPQNIDEVILVGGSTKLALFRSTVGQLFRRIPASHIDPDTVVAMGAGIQAGLKAKNNALDDVVLTDVCSYTLGTAVFNQDDPKNCYFDPIIERNMTVPVSMVKRYYTVQDNQTHLHIEVYQGENRYVSKNVLLGDLVCKVPRGQRGEEAVDIRFSYDMNGLLEVQVTIVSTGQTYTKVIERAPGVLTEQQKEQSLKKLAQLKFHPRDQEENQVLIAKGERLFESSLGETRDYIGNVLRDFDRVLGAQRPAEIAKFRVRLKELFEQLDDQQW